MRGGGVWKRDVESVAVANPQRMLTRQLSKRRSGSKKEMEVSYGRGHGYES